MSSVNYTLLDAGTYSAAANGASIPVDGIRELLVSVIVTGGSGTVNPFKVWLQSSPDGGTTWNDIPHSGALEDGASAITAAAREIVSKVAMTTSLKASAKYENFGNRVRTKFDIQGGGSETFSVLAVGKT